MNVDHRVRDQLILSRQLLADPSLQGLMALDPPRLLCDLMIAYGATELALAAICIQLDCVPGKKGPSLPDYVDSLRRAANLAIQEKGMDYVAELHKVRSDLLLRFRLPQPSRWTRVREETREYITGWCQQFLGLSLLDLSLPSASGSHASSSEPAVAPDRLRSRSGPVAPRYNCIGSADIRLARRGQTEKGRIENLSVGGCCVKSELLPEVGDEIEMTLEVNKTSFRVGGKVVHVPSLAADNGRVSEAVIGVQFKEMSAGARDRLQDLITELNMKIKRMVRHAAI